MKILIVSATKKEIFPLIEKFNLKFNQNFTNYTFEKLNIDIIITGIGAFFTLFELQKIDIKKYKFIINVGIAGDYTCKMKIGDTVFVKKDRFADIGSLLNNNFTDFFENNYILNNNEILLDSWIYSDSNNNLLKLPETSSITVNTLTNNKEILDYRHRIYNPEIESMEGAAFMYYCKEQNVKFAQIRTISNHISENIDIKVELKTSINNLNEKIIELLSLINEK